MKDIDVYLIQRFGMTADAIMRVMRNHKRIVNSEVHETIRHADFYMNPTDYCDPTDLPLRDWEEKDDDDDGYQNLYLYADDLFGEDGAKVFKDLISRGTVHGGMGSALEAMKLIEENVTLCGKDAMIDVTDINVGNSEQLDRTCAKCKLYTADGICVQWSRYGFREDDYCSRWKERDE